VLLRFCISWETCANNTSKKERWFIWELFGVRGAYVGLSPNKLDRFVLAASVITMRKISSSSWKGGRGGKGWGGLEPQRKRTGAQTLHLHRLKRWEIYDCCLQKWLWIDGLRLQYFQHFSEWGVYFVIILYLKILNHCKKVSEHVKLIYPNAHR